MNKKVYDRIKTGHYIPHSLWAGIDDPTSREEMMIGIIWEGIGEYRHIEFPNLKKKHLFIHTRTFDTLRRTCYECGIEMPTPSPFDKLGREEYACICGKKWISEWSEPLKEHTATKERKMTLIDNVIEAGRETVRKEKECQGNGGHYKDGEITVNGRPAWQCRCGYTGCKDKWEENND